jgi:hypothetical protein
VRSGDDLLRAALQRALPHVVRVRAPGEPRRDRHGGHRECPRVVGPAGGGGPSPRGAPHPRPSSNPHWEDPHREEAEMHRVADLLQAQPSLGPALFNFFEIPLHAAEASAPGIALGLPELLAALRVFALPADAEAGCITQAPPSRPPRTHRGGAWGGGGGAEPRAGAGDRDAAAPAARRGGDPVPAASTAPRGRPPGLPLAATPPLA